MGMGTAIYFWSIWIGPFNFGQNSVRIGSDNEQVPQNP